MVNIIIQGSINDGNSSTVYRENLTSGEFGELGSNRLTINVVSRGQTAFYLLHFPHPNAKGKKAVWPRQITIN